MSYLKEVEAWLDERVWTVINTVSDGGEDVVDGFKQEIKEKILESYRNGQEHGKSCKPRRGGVIKDFVSEAWRQVKPASKGKIAKPRR